MEIQFIIQFKIAIQKPTLCNQIQYLNQYNKWVERIISQFYNLNWINNDKSIGFCRWYISKLISYKLKMFS